MARSQQSKRPAQGPSRLVRAIARVAVPLAVVCGVLAAGALGNLVLSVLGGFGPYEAVKSVLGASFFASVAGWGLELRRIVRDWDVAILERRRLSAAGSES